MGFFSKLFGTEEEKGNPTKEELVEANVCPNCWGMQEYQDKIIQLRKDPTKSNINHDKQHQKAFVAQFVETHLDGIKLRKEEDRIHCPACKESFA